MANIVCCNHESALAEALARVDVWRTCADKQALKIITILSGLEALAGEWLTHAVNYDDEAKDVISDVYYAQLTTRADECRAKALRIRALIPAAANTESEETR